MTRLPYAKPCWRPSDVEAVPHRRDRAIDAEAPHDQLQTQAHSRVQRRLENPQKRDRTLLQVLRRRRSQPSQLGLRLRSNRSRKVWLRGGVLASLLSISMGGAVWSTLFLNGAVTYRGVPYQVVHKFWQDEAARAAYFSGNKAALHYRLASLGVERDIKNYYRDRFENEYALDQHIHQIMFDRTGYVGEAYQVDQRGRLVSKQYRKTL